MCRQYLPQIHTKQAQDFQAVLRDERKEITEQTEQTEQTEICQPNQVPSVPLFLFVP
jgi:hypothetical protein